ncbi:MAG: hypothetical protein NXI22_13025 [bacterium]|nr:hypothetical protein [bacterium]
MFPALSTCGAQNDANLCATETMNNAAYPLELLLRVITVSLETNKIVDALAVPLDDDRIIRVGDGAMASRWHVGTFQ